MSTPYDHRSIEKKWQERWLSAGTFSVASAARGRHTFVLDMFPYPSGDGLHVGHPEGYTATDIVARYLRLTGRTVLHPMGWDAFGLPAENAAIKKKTHPRIVTEQNIKNFKRQIQSIGFSYDWQREINTTDPKYYRWTQWIFLQLFKQGLAYEKEAPIWWCPKDKTGLANEEVVNGCCDRCGTPVEKKMLKQWMLKITAYAERLLDGLDKLDWPENIKALQRNWIGRSQGAEVVFEIPAQDQNDKIHPITVFTTRPDTLFGATYLVLSPEHPLIDRITTAKQKSAVQKYVKTVAAKSDLERTSLEKEKTGVFTGAVAVNPVNHEKIPIWIADYVLMSYGTGAIMAVPAHDERDYAFAKKYKLPIKNVIDAKFVVTGDGADAVKDGSPFIKRQAICAIIRNPKTDKYLCVSWKEHRMNGLVTGGVEPGEDTVKAALREIHEETGYTNARLVENPDLGVQTFFYHRVKKQNRWAQFKYLFFELKNEERDEVNQEESALHQIVWKSANELQDFFTVFEGSFIVNVIHNPNYVYTGEGILRDSGEFTDMNSEDARVKIVEKLQRNGMARGKVQYKLRDWVFSRQRYWGEPIPLTHCPNCQHTVESTPWVFNFYNTEGAWDRLMSGEKTVETRALNPEESARYFGNIKPEDYIKGVYKERDETAYFRVKKVYKLKNLGDLLQHPELIRKMKKRDRLPTLAELKKSHAYTPDYLDRIEKHGLIAFEVRKVMPGIIPLKEEQLPLELPKVEQYEPTGTGESPLANVSDWMNVKCRVCGHPAKRETNTMPQWAGSCWYYLRFCDPRNDQAFASPAALTAWLPVDLYVGGAEHAVLHLLYSRFWHMVLFDIGAIPAKNDQGESLAEPFTKLKNQGLILGPDGEKMSKSRGNVINPDEIIEKYGADTLRMYEMFMGPFEDAKPWSSESIIGVRRFLERAWGLLDKVNRDEGGRTSASHKYAAAIANGIEEFRFNTCVSDLMKWSNEWKSAASVPLGDVEVFVKLLSPFAPHLAEELWEKLGHEHTLSAESWPEVDHNLIGDDTVTIAVQVMGKLRGTLTLNAGLDQAEVETAAKAEPNVAKYLVTKPKKVIFVPDKLINFVM